MRISEYFDLKLDQQQLAFVDVDTEKDVELFIDPLWIHIGDDEWSKKTSATLIGFFDYILELYENDEIALARTLFDYAHEPNETCFGMSTNNPVGTGASAEMLNNVFNKILDYKMIEKGIVQRLEDVHVFIEDFGQDRLSDLVTNVIRKHLVDFTKEQCDLNGIELEKEEMVLGHYWDNDKKVWAECKDFPLIIDNKKIMFVPKKIVVKNYKYTAGQYCTHHVLVRRKEQHLQENTHLVHTRTKKNGEIVKKVYKKDIREEELKEAGIKEKQYVREMTEENPDLLVNFRTSIVEKLTNPVTTNKLSDEKLLEILNAL